MAPLGNLALGLVLSLGIAAFSLRRRALTRGGALCATLVGTLVLGLGGLGPGAALFLFFGTGTALSRFRQAEKERRGEGIVEKGGERDALQVLANGGAAALLCLGWAWFEHPALWIGAIASLAAANADTWATEIGMLSRRPPRHLLTWHELPAGTSGAVSVLGFYGMAAGAVLIALLGLVPPHGGLAPALAILAGGLGGALLDSLIGATVQERRQCERCGGMTEQRLHRCGGTTHPAAGIAGLDNDVVNGLATLGGGLLGAVLAYFVAG